MSVYEWSLLGLLISILFIAGTGIYPGGIIVPSYLVLFVDQPKRLIGTVAVALITWVCYQLASRFMILFGRRRFVFMILAGGIWTYLWVSLIPSFFPGSVEFRVIGWVIPGLMANHMERQGVAITLGGCVIVTTAIYFLGKLGMMIF